MLLVVIGSTKKMNIFITQSDPNTDRAYKDLQGSTLKYNIQLQLKELFLGKLEFLSSQLRERLRDRNAVSSQEV